MTGIGQTGPGVHGGGGKPPLRITDFTNVRKLIIKPTDENVKLTNLTPYAISKFLEFIIGSEGPPRSTSGRHAPVPSPQGITYSYLKNSGCILVKTVDSKQTNKLVKTTKFGDYDVSVFAPVGMNTVKGVVNVRGFNQTSEEEIVNEQKSNQVIAARHFSRKLENRTYAKTNTVTLTFLSPKLPEKIKIGMLIVDVRVYIPNPRRCYECFKFGHISKFCRNKPENKICGNCKGVHETRDCELDEKDFGWFYCQ